MLPLAVLFSTLMIGSASADTSSVCSQAFGSFSASNYPTACWRPYGSDSPFNRPLPTSPAIASNSSAIIANLTANNVNFEGGGPFAFTSDDGRDGIYYARSTDPVVTIHCTYQWGPGTCTGSNKVNIDGQQIHVPAGAMPQNNGTDAHMTVFDQANNLEYDFEHATWSADHQTLNVWAGAEIVSGPNLGTGLGGGGTAAGTATPAGLITEPELASGTINHALSINLPCTSGSVYPAGGAYGLACSQIAGENTAGAAPLGTLLQLNMSDAQIAASGAPAWERTIMTAMAHYGMYVNDTDGTNEIELEAESDISYTSLGGQALMANFISQQGGWYYSPLNRWIMEGPGIPINKLRVVDPCWAQGLCSGAGTTTSDPTPVTTPPTTTPVSTTPPATTPATTPVSTTPPATTPVTPTPTPTPVASAPVTAKPAPVTSAPAQHPAKKKPSKTKRRTSLARTASVSSRSCKASKSSTSTQGAKRAACTTATTATTRRPAHRR